MFLLIYVWTITSEQTKFYDFVYVIYRAVIIELIFVQKS